MKRLFISVMPLLAAGIIQAQAPAENLLTNGNFEKGTNGWDFDNWGKKSKMEMDEHELHNGKPTLRIENFDSCHSYVKQIIRAKPNTRYRLTGYIKTGHIEPATLGQRAGAALEIGTRGIYTAPLVEADTPWTKVTVDFSTTETGEIRVGPSFGTPVFMTGRAWFADLSLVALDDAVAVKPKAPASPSLEPSDSSMSTIEVLSKQAPNALEWALAPLDQTTPPDIRQNLMFLREDMLDEEAKKPAASVAAYNLGANLCNNLLETLNERDKMRVRAGYTGAQAKVNMGEITNQALEARRSAAPSGWRNYGAAAMAWPTYQREKDQREELRKAKENGAALENQRPIVEWADRSAQIRRIVDALYAQYRQAARGPRGK